MQQQLSSAVEQYCSNHFLIIFMFICLTDTRAQHYMGKCINLHYYTQNIRIRVCVFNFLKTVYSTLLIKFSCSSIELSSFTICLTTRKARSYMLWR